MKVPFIILFQKFLSGILLIAALLLTSCSLDSIPQPLPVNIKNSNRFPDELRGRWLSSEDSNWVIIDKRLLLFIGDSRSTKIVSGVWPKLSGNGIKTELTYGYEAEKYQQYDSLFHSLDTTRNYIISNKAIYEVRGNGMLSLGYAYVKNEDTFTFQKKDTMWLDLGRNMCIRKMDKRLYALNINNTLLAQESNWWQMVLLEQPHADTILCWGIGEKMKTAASFIYYFEEKYFSAAYYEADWDAATIIRLKDEGYFDLKGIFIKENKGAKQSASN